MPRARNSCVRSWSRSVLLVWSESIVHDLPSSEPSTLYRYSTPSCSQTMRMPVRSSGLPRSTCHHCGLLGPSAHHRVAGSPSTAAPGEWSGALRRRGRRRLPMRQIFRHDQIRVSQIAVVELVDRPEQAAA